MTAKKYVLLCVAFAAFLLPLSCTMFEVVTQDERINFFLEDLSSSDDSVRLSMSRHFYSGSTAVGGSLSDRDFWDTYFPPGEEYSLNDPDVDDSFDAVLFSTTTYSDGVPVSFKMELFDQTWYISKLVLNGTVLVQDQSPAQKSSSFPSYP